MAEMKIPVDYRDMVSQLMELVPDLIAVAIIEGDQIVYSTDNWDLAPYLGEIRAGWKALKLPSLNINGVKYTTLQLEVDTLVATSVKGEGHIVGFKDEEWKVITYVTPEGDRKAAIVELSRLIRSLSSKEPYMGENVELTSEYEGSGYSRAGEVDPKLRSEIEDFLRWMRDDKGLPGYLDYYLQQGDDEALKKLAEVYIELRQIFGV